MRAMRPSTFPPAGKVVPEYKGMLALAQKYAGQPFELVLFPCNQVLPNHPLSHPGGNPGAD